MHKILIIAATVLSLAACTTTQQGATVGAIGGGIIGASATGGNVVGAAVGAGIGAVAGAAAGEIIGYYGDSRDRCVWQRADGTNYIAPCAPRG